MDTNNMPNNVQPNNYNQQPGSYNAGGGAPYIPPEYKPISMWGYFGYQLLFAVPFIGFIILIVLAVSASNINLKNFARSYFCVLIIVLIVAAIIAATGAGAALVSSMT